MVRWLCYLVGVDFTKIKSGKITGDVIGKNKVTLRKSAILEGNLTTKILVVEEGAKVIGLCRMGDKTMTGDEEYVERVLKDVR